jgi:putative ABC transport system permease protein
VKTKQIIQTNLVFFARYFKLVALAILIAVAVIVGSLVIGDSVRSSLVKRVQERLGNTETVIFTQNTFLNKELLSQPIFKSSARGALLTNGFIPANGSLIPIMVWGVDDMDIPGGSAIINNALRKELNIDASDDLVLRLPAKGMVPSGSMFVTKNYTTSLRLQLVKTVGADEGGNVSLKNEQTLPLNLFVNRKELAWAMDIQGKINLILSADKISAGSWQKAWDYQTSGLSVQQRNGFSEITSDRVFLQKDVVDNIKAHNASANRMFSYLANALNSARASVPYSFITASDSYKNEPLQKDEIILSDYTANRLKVSVGDPVSIQFFISRDFKTLETDSVFLRVKQIVPLAELQADTTLSANFPGISNVERCTEWNSDLPINMDLITKEDERYWEQYRTTPKAILPYKAVADKWGSAYGTATDIRVYGSSPDLSSLQPQMFGIQVIHPRESGIYAAKNGVDFSGLFIALGFFIIISAMLLMIIPLSEMLYQRKDELDLLKSLGYTTKRIHALLWKESIPVVLIASILGVITGLIYTAVVMWLLGSFWKGATHTEGFSVYPHWITLITGFATGIVLSLVVLHRVISNNLKEKTPKKRSGRRSLQLKKWLLIGVSLITLFVALYNIFVLTSVILFSVVGALLMITFALLGDYFICTKGKAAEHAFSSEKMIFRTIYANKKQALMAYISLAFGVFTVFSVGLNRQGFSDSSQISKATGGYDLWCESSIPVYHNINTRAGRNKLNLQELPAQAGIMQCLRYSADEASCLNLNKVATPSVLGVDLQKLFKGPLAIQNSIYGQSGDALVDRFKKIDNPIVPALIDAAVLEWSLAKKLGDTLYYTSADGGHVGIVLAGTLPNTIFQGYILIDQHLFSGIWPTIKGSELWLMDVGPDKTEEVKALVSQAMHEYGVRVTTTSDRLKQFYSVTDTYLTIFLTLGGIGLLLGIFAFIIVIRKNLSIRQKEIALYGTLGFQPFVIKDILYRENRIVPLYAIATGIVSAVIGIGSGYINVNTGIWLTASIFTLLFVLLTIVFVKQMIRREMRPKERTG